MTDQGGWDRVAERLQRELALRGLSLRQVETASGVNFRTLKKLLDGGTVRTARLTPLAEFLGWEGDAFDRIRAGDEPTPLSADSADEGELRFRSLERRVDRLEALLEDALRPPDRPAAP